MFMGGKKDTVIHQLMLHHHSVLHSYNIRVVHSWHF